MYVYPCYRNFLKNYYRLLSHTASPMTPRIAIILLPILTLILAILSKAMTMVPTGTHHVALPDGRQVVNYKANSCAYVADVKYTGEAKYPEYNQYNADSPTPHQPAKHSLTRRYLLLN